MIDIQTPCKASLIVCAPCTLGQSATILQQPKLQGDEIVRNEFRQDSKTCMKLQSDSGERKRSRRSEDINYCDWLDILYKITLIFDDDNKV